MADVLILSYRDIAQMLTIETLIPIIEAAFQHYADGDFQVYPVVREQLDERNAVFGIKSGYLGSNGSLGLKAGGFWSGNTARGLTAHQSTVLLLDPNSGMPICLADGNYITYARTGAAGAVAARRLSRANSATVGLIGTGNQGRAQLLGLKAVRPIRDVRVYDSQPGAAARFAETISAPDMAVVPVNDPRSAVQGADVVITATPSTTAIIDDSWIEPGMHISAIGADTRGKQELDPNIFRRARVVADDIGQAQQLGECQHALAAGIIRTEEISTLGDIIAGRRQGRQQEDEITIFDATGLAFQDLVAAQLAYHLSAERGLGLRVSL